MKKFTLLVLSVLLCLNFADAQVVGSYTAKNKSAFSVKKKKPRNKNYIGLNLGVGTTYSDAYNSLDFSLGTDIAFSATNKFAMGIYASYASFTKMNTGLLFVHGDYAKKSAFFWGIGPSFSFPYSRKNLFDAPIRRKYAFGVGASLRIGFMLKSNFYLGLNFSYFDGGFDDYYRSRWVDWHSCDNYTVGLTFGYNLNGIRNKKNK